MTMSLNNNGVDVRIYFGNWVGVFERQCWLCRWSLFLKILKDIKRERWVLTQEGDQYAKYGSPEVLLFLAVPPEGIAQEELQVI